MGNKIMKKLLFYIEPHPIRNSFSQFLNAEVRKIIPALVNQLPEDCEVRIFGNDATITAVVHDIGKVAPICLRPTEKESNIIYDYLRQWDDLAIQERNDLVMGRGKITEFYYGILDRIHRDVFDFDYVLAWSDNGAVKKYAEDNNLISLFAELGPTRMPFPPTIYFDHEGTNGMSSVRKAKLEDFKPQLVLSRRIWSVKGVNANVYDRPLTLTVDETKDEPFKCLHNKYIFVALQLADDLNTVLCSRYNNPVEFLRQIIEDFKDSGYDLVVKGHPGAKNRAYNLKAQYQAKLLADSYDHVHFLDSSVGAVETIDWYVHAEAVISINSSLSFEALLSGKKSFSAGEAVYNISGLMDYTSSAIDVNDEVSKNLDVAVSFLMGHYFHPNESVFNTKLIYRLFDFYREMKDEGILGTGSFWSIYAERFSEGIEMLIPDEFRDEAGRDTLEISIPSLLVNTYYNINSLTEMGDNIELGILDKFGKKSKMILPVEAIFVQCLDKVEVREKTMFVLGWAYEKDRKIPPINVLVFCKGEYISRHRVVNKRSDVQEAFNLSNTMDYGYRFECMKKGEVGDYLFLLISESGKVQIVRKR
ncbi:hypothetical protein [Selenomonas sp. KH1T6]|uniref:capsular polysaccharide export protein, LipB/KpsS family n=1 Tax=Selenomonas sp. KH1T6 TaxID=3158784 RepID=UPI0008A7AFD1|nr:capsular polysaccharide export protein [Selenomonas ruminantium]